MKPKGLLALLAVVILSTGASQAGFFDLAVNNNAFDIWLGFDLGKNEEAQTMLIGRYLYNDDEDSSIPAFLVAFGSTPSANDSIRFALGAQVYFGEAHNQDIKGVALGGTGNWTPGGWKGIYVGGRLFWTPGVFCFGDTDGAMEWGVEGGYNINEKMRVYLEYSDFNADVENAGSFTVDNGVKFGFGAKF